MAFFNFANKIQGLATYVCSHLPFGEKDQQENQTKQALEPVVSAPPGKRRSLLQCAKSKMGVRTKLKGAKREKVKKAANQRFAHLSRSIRRAKVKVSLREWKQGKSLPPQDAGDSMCQLSKNPLILERCRQRLGALSTKSNSIASLSLVHSKEGQRFGSDELLLCDCADNVSHPCRISGRELSIRPRSLCELLTANLVPPRVPGTVGQLSHYHHYMLMMSYKLTRDMLIQKFFERRSFDLLLSLRAAFPFAKDFAPIRLDFGDKQLCRYITAAPSSACAVETGKIFEIDSATEAVLEEKITQAINQGPSEDADAIESTKETVSEQVVATDDLIRSQILSCSDASEVGLVCQASLQQSFETSEGEGAASPVPTQLEENTPELAKVQSALPKKKLRRRGPHRRPNEERVIKVGDRAARESYFDAIVDAHLTTLSPQLDLTF